MIRAFSCYLALRYLFSRRINLLGTIGVAVAVWALIVVIAVFSGFIAEIRDNIRGATPQLLLDDLKKDTSYEEVAQLLATDPDVHRTAPRLRHYAIYFPYALPTRMQESHSLKASSLHFEYIEMIGIDPDLERETLNLELWVTDAVDTHYSIGDSRRTPDPGKLVADPAHPFDVPEKDLKWFMRRMGQAVPAGPLLTSLPGLLLGSDRMRYGRMFRGQQVDLVTVHADQNGELRKIRRMHAIAGRFKTKHRTFDDTRALVPIESLRDMLGHSEFDLDSVDIISGVAIRLKPGANMYAAARRIENLVAKDFGGRVRTWEEQNAIFLAVVDQERGMMKLILFAVMLVSSFLIYATLHMMVTHKIKDIGIITSMGANQSGVLHIFMLTGTIIAVIGCAIGATLGCLSAIYLNDMNDFTSREFGFELFPTKIYSMDVIPYRLDASWILQVVAGALVITLISAWLPARKAARMEPVKALAHV